MRKLKAASGPDMAARGNGSVSLCYEPT